MHSIKLKREASSYLKPIVDFVDHIQSKATHFHRENILASVIDHNRWKRKAKGQQLAHIVLGRGTLQIFEKCERCGAGSRAHRLLESRSSRRDAVLSIRGEEQLSRTNAAARMTKARVRPIEKMRKKKSSSISASKGPPHLPYHHLHYDVICFIFDLRKFFFGGGMETQSPLQNTCCC